MTRNLPSIVEDIAEELAMMFRTAALLQEQLGVIRPDPDGIVALQSLDALTQGLASLSEFLSTIADKLPRDCHPDLEAAVRSLCLSAMARRLGQFTSEIAEDCSGDLELFDA